MIYRQYKDTEVRPSLLGFGGMRFPVVERGGERVIDRVTAEEMLDLAYSRGVNYFDTAYGYHNGESEKFLGEALKKYPRGSFFLATKMPLWRVKAPKDSADIFSEQRSRLGAEYFDFYLAHCINDGNYAAMRANGAYEFMREMQAQGRLRRVGFSFHGSVELLRRVVGEFEWDFAQIQYNYLDCVIAHAAEEYDILKEAGIPIIVMEPVRGGALADLCEEANAVLKAARPSMSVPSWAIRFAASRPEVLTVLSGMSTPEQVRDNLSTVENFIPLDAGDERTLARAVEVFKKYFSVPCTKCNYCRESCPSDIDIPEMVRLYSQYRLEKDAEDFKKEYLRVPEGHRAADCRNCGVCESRCPQNIGIAEIMDCLKALNSGAAPG